MSKLGPMEMQGFNDRFEDKYQEKVDEYIDYHAQIWVEWYSPIYEMETGDMADGEPVATDWDRRCDEWADGNYTRLAERFGKEKSDQIYDWHLECEVMREAEGPEHD